MGNTVHGRWTEVLALHNLKKTKVWSKWRANWDEGKQVILKDVKGMTVNTAAKLLPKGKFVIGVNRHVLAIVDNKIYDGWDSQKTRVRSIFQIDNL